MTPGQKIPTEIKFSPPITVSITKNYQNDGRKLPGKKLPGEFAPATREFFPSTREFFSSTREFFPACGNITPQGIFTFTNLQYGQSVPLLVAQLKSYKKFI